MLLTREDVNITEQTSWSCSSWLTLKLINELVICVEQAHMQANAQARQRASIPIKLASQASQATLGQNRQASQHTPHRLYVISRTTGLANKPSKLAKEANQTRKQPAFVLFG